MEGKYRLIRAIGEGGYSRVWLAHNTVLDVEVAVKLIYLTDVPGVYADYPDESTLISRTDAAGLEQLVHAGKADRGMVPKLTSCVQALRAGVTRAHILDGRIPHALLLEFFTREGIGTMVDP